MVNNLRILYDANLFGLKELMSESAVESQPYHAQVEFEKLAPHFDAAIIRTVTKIHKVSLARKGSLKWIATASAGIDHIDQDYLKQLGLPFSNAAGSNAQSVAEYVICAIARMLLENDLLWSDLCVGIIGVGHVGGRLHEILQKFGVRTFCYDPPRELREDSFKSCSIDELEHANVLSFHTPLDHSGEFPTHHLFADQNALWDSGFLGVINTSRGGVLDENLLSRLRESGKIDHLVTDVWEREPQFDRSFRQEQFIATPHIAGYSAEAKLKASWISWQQICQHFGLVVNRRFEDWSEQLLPQRSPSEELVFKSVRMKNSLEIEDLQLIVNAHPLKSYHEALASIDQVSNEQQAVAFGTLRKQHALRREYGL